MEPSRSEAPPPVCPRIRQPRVVQGCRSIASERIVRCGPASSLPAPPGCGGRAEQGFVKKFVPKPRVEDFDVAVLLRLARARRSGPSAKCQPSSQALAGAIH